MQDRMRDMLTMGDDTQVTIDTMTRMYALTKQLTGVTHEMVLKTRQMVADTNDPEQPGELRRLLPSDP